MIRSSLFPTMLYSTLAAGLALLASEGTTVTGDHFRVHLDFSSDVLAEQALDAVEALWPRAGELYGDFELAGDDRLEVHLYRTERAYETAEYGMTRGRFRNNRAFAHWDTKSAHVVLDPPVDASVLEEFGLPDQTLRLLVHEAAHLARFARCESYRVHPAWLGNGAASWIDQAVMEDLGRSDPVEDPWASQALHELSVIVREDRLPSAREILLDDLDQLEGREFYAVHETFLRFWKESRDAKALGDAIETVLAADAPDDADALRTAVVDAVPRAVLERLSKGFARYAKGLEPAWNSVFRSLQPLPAREDGTRRWLQMAFPETNAVCWRVDRELERRYEVGGRLRILPVGGRQMNLLLARSDEGFVSVAFNAGYGVTVFDYRGGRWNRVARQEVSGVVEGTEFAFEVSVKNRNLKVEVDGERVVDIDIDRDLDGPFGLGAQASSAGVWTLE